MITLKHNEIPELPTRFHCPICKSGIVITDINEWEETDDGTWRVSDGGVLINCTSEPDIDSEDWHGWMNGHWSMPYVDWLPVCESVLEWLDANYRFEMEREP